MVLLLGPLTRMFCRHQSVLTVSLGRAISSKCVFEKNDASRILINAKENAGITYKELANTLKVNKVWLVAAMQGQHPFGFDQAERLIEILSIPCSQDERDNLRKALCKIPENRASGTKFNDPVVRRLQEIVDLYGDAIKALIREEAGDGIMSAIDCTINVDKNIVQRGSKQEVRIMLQIDGKYLQYVNS